ncbi:MAG: ATP-binding protein [Bilifractor sp.]
MRIFKRKAYEKLLKWKQQDSDRYSLLIEGARRVGKSTLVEEFARNEYRSYIMIDFAHMSSEVKQCFDDIENIDLFFLRLQNATGKTLYPHESLVIFDEVQLFPRARQAMKHLVKDGRYSYIETGSLISIKRNVKDILIPSEEKKIKLYPMDYEEFLWACGNGTYDLVRQLYKTGKPAGQALNRKLMRDFRLYMAVGGMPQAVEAYIEKKNFAEIDSVKRSIINLYEDDFRKIDPSGRISSMFHYIPAQLSKDVRRYYITGAVKQVNKPLNTDRLLFDLIDSQTVNICYNSTDPRVSLSLTADLSSYKLYIADTGLFLTLMFMDRPEVQNEIYGAMLSDRLPANLGYLYENAAAQIIVSYERKLYYHTWNKKGSTHYFETDFLISAGEKVDALEVKSSGTGKHESLTEFRKVFRRNLKRLVVLSQRDVSYSNGINYLPIYMLPCFIEDR